MIVYLKYVIIMDVTGPKLANLDTNLEIDRKKK